jgi:hypothetical protein
MADDLQYGVVLEPPVSVANGLLDATRRLAVEVGARCPGVRWVPPERYLATVAFVSGASLPDSAAEGLLRAAREVEELGLQAGFPVLVSEGTRGRVVAPVATKAGDLGDSLDAVVAALRDVGLDVVVPPGPTGFTVAHVEGEEALAKVGAALANPREGLLAGWLAGGLCVASGPAVPPELPWLGVRQRSVALKRLGARRPAPTSPRPAKPPESEEPQESEERQESVGPQPTAAEPSPVSNGMPEE